MKSDEPGTHAREVFAENLKNRRLSMKLTQVEFAKKLEITQAELSKLESGGRGFTSDSLTDIAKRLGVEPWELLRSFDDFVSTKEEPVDRNQHYSDAQSDQEPFEEGSTRQISTLTPGSVEESLASVSPHRHGVAADNSLREGFTADTIHTLSSEIASLVADALKSQFSLDGLTDDRRKLLAEIFAMSETHVRIFLRDIEALHNRENSSTSVDPARRKR